MTRTKGSRKRKTEEQWIEQLSIESGVSANLVRQVWTTQLDIIERETKTSPDRKFHVPGFGTYSITMHKGHPLNLDTCGPNDRYPDYEVLKWKIDKTFKKRMFPDT